MNQAISALRGRQKGLLFATVGHFIWGLSFLFTRIGLQSATPSVLLSARFIVAFFLMNIPVLLGKVKISFAGKNIRLLILLGVLQPVVYFFFESYGILYTNATFSSIIIALSPAAALILARIFLKEKSGRRQTLFLLLPIAGAIIATVSKQGVGASAKPIGVLFLLGACFTGALYRIVNRRISGEYTAYVRTYIMALLGFIVFPLAAVIESAGNWDMLIKPFLVPSFLLSAGALGALCSFAAFFLVNAAAAELTVAQLSVFSGLITVVSIIAGVLILREPFSMSSLISVVLIIVGVWNVNAKPAEIENG